MNWPVWWEWDLELTPHLEKRMIQRGFNDISLREMLGRAYGFHLDVEPERWVIETRHAGVPWEVIVEPDYELKLLVVVTAYPTA